LKQAVINTGKTASKARIYKVADSTTQAYLSMLWGAFAFAALGHPSKVAVIGLTQIVFACLFDLIIWKQRFDALTLCGILLVMAPTAWLLLHSPLRRRDREIHTSV
jgi:drug/metabolite transporter (DMT)-like permease